MKLLLENWNKFLKEESNSLHHTCPEADPAGFKTYYRIDRNDPPSIEQILNCWVKNRAAIYDSNVNHLRPALYQTSDLTPYREYPRGYLRNQPETQRYQDLKKDIEENGYQDPIIVMFGENGVVKIGEGNHRHEIALELGIEKIPVRFIFWQNVSKPSAQELDGFYEDEVEEPEERPRMSDEEYERLMALIFGKENNETIT
jgi:hypothetical protein